MIRVMLDSNEQNTKRANDLIEAVVKHSDTFTWDGFKELPVDVRFKDDTSHKYISVELKEVPDMVASVTNGHLAKQVIMLKDAQEPGFIVCIGSPKDIMAAIPPVADGKYRGKDKIFRDFGRIKHFTATANAEGYPVFYWNFDWAPTMLTHIQEMFCCSTIFEHLHKDKSNPVSVAMLCMIPGIGSTTAQALIEQYGSIKSLTTASVDDLSEIKINGRKLGKRSTAIVEAFN